MDTWILPILALAASCRTLQTIRTAITLPAGKTEITIKIQGKIQSSKGKRNKKHIARTEQNRMEEHGRSGFYTLGQPANLLSSMQLPACDRKAPVPGLCHMNGNEQQHVGPGLDDCG